MDSYENGFNLEHYKLSPENVRGRENKSKLADKSKVKSKKSKA